MAVLIINQCMADPGAMSMFGPVIKPVGGHVLAHASTTRCRERARAVVMKRAPL